LANAVAGRVLGGSLPGPTPMSHADRWAASPFHYALAVPDADLTELLERLSVAAVALTTLALAEGEPGFDLTFPQWRVLLVLGEGSDGAKVSEVASRVAVTLPATSRQLRRLERRGLVEIAPDPRDRRAARARLTTRGVEVRDRILRYRRDRISCAASGLELSNAGLQDLAVVAEALSRYR
jgi:DNA-binding MarR family transcriptional regulator